VIPLCISNISKFNSQKNITIHFLHDFGSFGPIAHEQLDQNKAEQL